MLGIAQAEVRIKDIAAIPHFGTEEIVIGAVPGDRTLIAIFHAHAEIGDIIIPKTHAIALLEIGTIFRIFQILAIKTAEAVFRFHEVVTGAVFSMFSLEIFYALL